MHHTSTTCQAKFQTTERADPPMIIETPRPMGQTGLPEVDERFRFEEDRR